MKWYLIVIIFLTGLTLTLFFVHPQPEGCECDGFSFGMCLGSVRCEVQEESCIPLTCENRYELLGNININNDDSRIYTILIIDASRSMEGENLDATKRASEAFVQEITAQEYLAIIEFNEEATKLTDFTTDKISLYSSIDLINPTGRTRFLEPFVLANEMFDQVPTNSRKYILFLSDGAPEDEEEDFIAQIRLLEEKNVNTFALAFADKSNEALMKQIASKDENLFLVSNAEDIEEKFVEAFTTILEEGDILLQTTSEKNSFRRQEQIELELFSLHNKQNLLLDETYCPLESTSFIEAQQEGKFTRILGRITSGVIGFSLNTLDAGSYEIVAHTKVFLDECTMSTTEQLGIIDIIEEGDCNISCENIGVAMSGGANVSYTAQRAETSWIILVDKSSSMDEGEHLRKAKEDVELFLSLMPATDVVSIGSFHNRVDIIEEFANPTDFVRTDFEAVVPSASTSLHFALEAAAGLAKRSVTPRVHTIVLSDGEYGIQNLGGINDTLSSMNGCVSTINYGTHLLTDNESAYNLLQDARNCGEDILTRPSRDELSELLESNLSGEPELLIGLQKRIVGNQSEYVVTTRSSFTGKVPLAENERCQLSPLTKIVFEDGREIVGNQFVTEINESFQVQSGFENGQCSFSASRDVTFEEAQHNESLLQIVAIVALVLAINMLVFIYVLSRKLKKLTRIR